MTRVEVLFSDAHKYLSEPMFQFAVRQQLKSQGVPIGPWDTSTVEHGVLRWWDEFDRRVIEWEESK